MHKDNNEIDTLFENDQIFKPLTDGLGFHHSIKDKKEIQSSLANKKAILKEDLEHRATDLGLKSVNMQKMSTLDMGALAPFYATEEVNEDTLELNLEGASSPIASANMALRCGAWLIDTFLVLTLTTLAVISILFISEIPLDFLGDSFLMLDFVLSTLLISLMLYTFYFTFFDKTFFSTPGKRLFGLRVVRVKGTSISLTQSFSRVLITISSILSLGLGSIIKVQDKLTETMVIKK